MIKVSNEKLVNSIEVLGSLLNEKLPIVIAYALNKNIDKINSELKIYNTTREKLIDECAEKEDGKPKIENGNFVIKADYLEKWNQEMSNILAIENELELKEIELSKLEKSSVDITPIELMKIDYMIKE
ncbi:hypothetical protein [Clostridium sp. HBUAS56017]|uniref:hypothetical protein n=1 Tax=Clostridium sp. HBUAS56017 TaxID=2571128 RepID=UPI0011786AA3|nr:hypothetical protein [Clostridium sp. HBUAS56017]